MATEMWQYQGPLYAPMLTDHKGRLSEWNFLSWGMTRHNNGFSRLEPEIGGQYCSGRIEINDLQNPPDSNNGHMKDLGFSRVPMSRWDKVHFLTTGEVYHWSKEGKLELWYVPGKSTVAVLQVHEAPIAGIKEILKALGA